MVFDESGVDPPIAAGRGYSTVRSRAELLDFKKYQRRAPALRIPIYSPDGKTTSSQLRPNRPRKDKKGKPIKYETAGGSRVILDVHPSMRGRVRGDEGEDLWVTEGIKKADALTSRDLPTIGLIGVWNWQRDGEMLPCWDHVQLAGRRVYVVFDSDIMVKEGVQLALERLVAALEGRGAEVLVVYLPGPEKGVDDYLVADHTVAELKMLARKFVPEDVGRIRLSRDERLRIAVEALRGRWWAHDWGRLVGTGERPNSTRGHSVRDAVKALIDHALRHGTPTEDGVRVKVSTRTLAIDAATSRPTLGKSLKHAEAEGILRIEEASGDEARSYVLLAPEARANLVQYGSKGAAGEDVTSQLQAYDPGGKGLRASPDVPRLRWSSPGRKPKRGTVSDTRRVRHGPPGKGRDSIIRPGKVRGAALDYLEASGGSAGLDEMAEALHKARPRDFRRRTLPMLEADGLLTVDSGVVVLSDAWRERLQEVRETGREIASILGEDGAAELDAELYRRQREAYRRRKELRPDPHWTNTDADGYVEELEPDDVSSRDDTPEQKVSPLAAAVRGYLARNPGDACEPLGWIGSTLWALDLYPGKPTPAETRGAIDELGGERYLRDLLKKSRGEAA